MNNGFSPLLIILAVVKLLTVILVSVTLLVSCVDDHGNRVEGGELSVYFDRDSDIQKAKDIAAYWKENDLLTGVEQDLKLTFQDSTFYLYLIKRKELELGSLDFQERKLLIQLQSDLQDSLFKGESLELIISDDHFKPLMNIND